MPSDSEDAEAAANRLEAALERIAQVATREAAQPTEEPPAFDTEELAARLDGLIDRLRTALGNKAG